MGGAAILVKVETKAGMISQLTRRHRNLGTHSVRQSLWRNQTSLGMMSLVSKPLRTLSKRQSSCPRNSQISLLGSENHGKVSYCTDHQELVRLSWLRHVPVWLTLLSSVSHLRILSVNGSVNLRNLSKPCLSWPEKEPQLLSSLMKSILWSPQDLTANPKPHVVSKPNSWCKCKVSAKTAQDLSWSLALRISHGGWIQL